jgi:tetratricopeptide (TPR) repeat protein
LADARLMRKPALEALQEASALFAAGRLDEAKRACRKLVAKRPDIAEAHVLLGEIFRGTGDEARARECSTRAFKLRPAWSEAHLELTLGDVFADFQRYGEAELRYREALRLDPGLADARFNLAAALCAGGREGEAIIELQALLERDPRAADARHQLVELLFAQRRFDALDAVCREGMVLHPASSLYPQKLGIALWWRDRHEEALAAFHRAAEQARDPQSDEFAAARFLEANSLLSLGRYAEAWDAYRWRHTRRTLRASLPAIVEDPRVIAATSDPKRLRIVCEQGLGDEIFFLRFAPALREGGHRLSVSCGPKLAPLLASMPNVVDAVNEPADAADFTLASGDLALASGLEIAPPLALPVEPQRRATFAERLRAFGPPPYIAVTWRSGLLPDEPKLQDSPYWAKHVPAELLGVALRSVDARVIVVQRRPQPDDMRRLTQALGRQALDLSVMNDDLRDALALLSLADDYIGVSNTNFHLRAGLKDRPARVLVSTPAEWRWGLRGSSSPWFPGFVLYRADLGPAWSSALSRLQRDLSAAASQQS